MTSTSCLPVEEVERRSVSRTSRITAAQHRIQKGSNQPNGHEGDVCRSVDDMLQDSDNPTQSTEHFPCRLFPRSNQMAVLCARSLEILDLRRTKVGRDSAVCVCQATRLDMVELAEIEVRALLSRQLRQ